MTGLWVLLGALVLAGVLGVLLRLREGRISGVRGEAGRPAGRELPEPVRLALAAAPESGSSVTLLQLSTTFCAPCRRTGVLLAELARRTEGLRHVELDVTDQPKVAIALGVQRTPTTLALDTRGVELLRVGGVPRPDTLLNALRFHLPS